MEESDSIKKISRIRLSLLTDEFLISRALGLRARVCKGKANRPPIVAITPGVVICRFVGYTFPMARTKWLLSRCQEFL